MNTLFLPSRNQGEKQKLHLYCFFLAVINAMIPAKNEKGRFKAVDWAALNYSDSVKIKISETETITRHFDEVKNLLFINHRVAYTHYFSWYVKDPVYRLESLDQIIKILKTCDAYIGQTKAKKIGLTSQRCMIFDIDKIDNPYIFEVKRWYNVPPTVHAFFSSQEELDKYKTKPGIREYVESKIDLAIKFRSRADSLMKSVQTIQDCCGHDYVHVTSTPHYELYECSICKKENRI